MLAISLIFVGSTLILNGILFLRETEMKTIMILNLFTAGIIFIFNIYSIMASTTPAPLVGHMGGLLFGLTNLLIAFDVIFKTDGKGTGYFSLIATVIALSLSAYYFATVNVFRGVAWIVWSMIWLFSYIGFSLSAKFKTATNIMFIVQGIVTTGIFGLLQLFQIVQF